MRHRQSRPTRRQFLTGASSAVGWGLAAPYVLSVGCDGQPGASEIGFALRSDDGQVFDLSVASGDPTATGVILWTHIRPPPSRPPRPCASRWRATRRSRRWCWRAPWPPRPPARRPTTR